MGNRTPTQQLLDFVIDQKLDLEYYDLQLTLKIRERFIVHDKNTGRIAPRRLVNTIIEWEQGKQKASLELTLTELYKIEVVSQN